MLMLEKNSYEAEEKLNKTDGFRRFTSISFVGNKNHFGHWFRLPSLLVSDIDVCRSFFNSASSN